ncbi:biopolymer transporter ExbB [Marinobacter sp. EhC06]|jgi:biopolymer transport protein ExbB|uniref:MotA/TolQ/ExbB proton channel family protein n=1 Tax=Marinobacter TaxID=2742 RepID=UPI0007D99338|nr:MULTISPECIES: MotA/TolQ/ExbB proton channel family protein [unclassified Marinobacter]OAN88006.1 biopolymer transporter ExbB [Marinobacter sp. EhN04]OAN90990.1 biopolymer transporter ExbB [Marinobacter sp. EhC06]
MATLLDAYEAILIFLETGGDVLVIIGVTIFIMWMLIVERIWFFQIQYRANRRHTLAQWEGRTERKSWQARQIRQAMVSRCKQSLTASLPLIQTLIAICPLLGLLGTVTGMIEVFTSISFGGTGNARVMASGVSKATIPTMAGMVGALSGLFAITYLKRFAQRESELIEDRLTID